MEILFNKLNDEEKNVFLLLTKYTFDFQTNKKIQIFNASILNNPLHSFPVCPLKKPFDEYNDVFRLYRNSNDNLFEEMIQIIKRTTPIENLNPAFKNNLNNDEIKNIEHFFNMAILINTIKTTLKNKTNQEINEYKLLEKLNAVNTDNPNAPIANILNLATLNSLNATEIQNLLENTNNSYISVLTSYDAIKYDDYNEIFKIFSLFE